MTILKDLQKIPFQESLFGERIQLIKPNVKLAGLLWQSILKDRAARGSSWTWLNSRQQLEEYLTKKEDDFNKNISVLYLIKKEDEIIGTIYLHTLNYKDHKVEVGSGD